MGFKWPVSLEEIRELELWNRVYFIELHILFKKKKNPKIMIRPGLGIL